MPASRTAAEFDEISPAYDETRSPLEGSDVAALAGCLRDWGVTELLEVGVGTGRIALPLRTQGFEVVGVDASRGMLARARAKGVPRLVRGSAYRLPFPDRAFDAGLFVHVLHLLDDPATGLGEACRVSRRGAVALVRPPRSREEGAGPGRRSARRLVIERLRAEGVPVPDRAEGGPPRRERELLRELPPDRLTVLAERDVTEPLADQLAMFERRASRWTLRVPPELLARAVAEARAEIGDATHTYHQVLALALWERPPHPSGGREPGGPELARTD